MRELVVAFNHVCAFAWKRKYQLVGWKAVSDECFVLEFKMTHDEYKQECADLGEPFYQNGWGVIYWGASDYSSDGEWNCTFSDTPDNGEQDEWRVSSGVPSP